MRIGLCVVSVTMPRKMARDARRKAKRVHGRRGFSLYVRCLIDRDLSNQIILDPANTEDARVIRAIGRIRHLDAVAESRRLAKVIFPK